MKKFISMLLIPVITALSLGIIFNLDPSYVSAKKEPDIFLKEVVKPEGSGYIFDQEDGVNISVD